MTIIGEYVIMRDRILQKWLVVHPASLLWALEEVENGRSAAEVMIQVLDVADESMEEQSDDGEHS